MKNPNRLIYDCLLLFAIIMTAGCSTGTSPSNGPLVIAEQGFFFVGGRYVPVAKDDYIMADQMYVHYQIPHEKKHPYPIIMIHGGGQTANNFESTPDGPCRICRLSRRPTGPSALALST